MPQPERTTTPLNEPTKVILRFLVHAPGEKAFWKEVAEDLVDLPYSQAVQTLAADIRDGMYEQSYKLKNPFPELASFVLDQVDWQAVAVRLTMGK